jgi:GNAT superfamily N-acetyltransferase
MEIHQSRDPAAATAPRLKRNPVPGYIISFNRDRLDFTSMVGWLLGSHWTHWQKPHQIHTALKNSIVIGAYHVATGAAALDIRPVVPLQVGFARVVSDHATNSILTDLYVSESHRRRGVARLLMEAVTQHDSVRPTLCVLGCRSFLRSFYSDFGFVGVGGDIMVRNPTP